MKQIEVVAAIIHDKEGRIFATQRGYGDYKDGWEFPGGKMEPGESPEQALKREIWEELETEIIVEWLVKTVEWDYPQRDGSVLISSTTWIGCQQIGWSLSC